MLSASAPGSTGSVAAQIPPAQNSFSKYQVWDRSTWSQPRRMLARMVEHRLFDRTMGILIMSNVVLMVIEADYTAKCGRDPTCKAPPLVINLNYGLLAVYTVEVAARLFVYCSLFFRSIWNNLDLLIVVAGYADLIVSTTDHNIPNLTVLRVFRVLRLIRTVRVLSLFPELRELVRGFGSAMKAMFWGVVLILLMLGIWALLFIEILAGRPQPEFQDVWCDDAFSSFFFALIYFFQTLVAGDSWGVCAIPTSRLHPELFFLLAIALLSIELGLTNLVLTVIVEAANGARERDHEQRVKDKKKYEQECFSKWFEVIRDLDEDQNGTISRRELVEGFDTHSDVQLVLALLDIDKNDLEQFFLLLDRDDSGDVSYKEFFDCLRKAHSQDVRMTMMNVKLQLSQLSHQMQSLTDVVQRLAENGTGSETPLSQSISTRPTKKYSEVMAQESEGGCNAMPRSAPRSLPTRASTAVPAEQSLARALNEKLSSLGEQLERRLEKISQDTLENAELLRQNTKSLEAVLASIALERDVGAPPRAQASAASALEALSEGSRRSSEGASGCSVCEMARATMRHTRPTRRGMSAAPSDSSLEAIAGSRRSRLPSPKQRL